MWQNFNVGFFSKTTHPARYPTRFAWQYEVGWLVVGAFRPVNHKRLHQGWIQIPLYLQVIHFTSHFYHKSCFFFFFIIIIFLAYLYSAGTQRGNLHPTEWSILLCGPTQEPVLATANTGKTSGEVLEKCRWIDRKGRNKQEISGSKRSMYDYKLTYARI